MYRSLIPDLQAEATTICSFGVFWPFLLSIKIHWYNICIHTYICTYYMCIYIYMTMCHFVNYFHHLFMSITHVYMYVYLYLYVYTCIYIRVLFLVQSCLTGVLPSKFAIWMHHSVFCDFCVGKSLGCFQFYYFNDQWVFLWAYIPRTDSQK